MALTDKERRELKKQGFVYERRLARWMKPEEIDEYYRKKEQSEQIEFLIYCGAVAFVIVFFFIMVAAR